MEEPQPSTLAEVAEYTVTDAVVTARHASSATGTSHSTRTRARLVSGTVPTVVTRPSPCAAVTTAGQVPTNGCSYSTITSAPATTRLSAHPVAWAPGGGSRRRRRTEPGQAGKVGELLVGDPGCIRQECGLDLKACTRLLVGVGRTRAEHEVTAGFAIAAQPLQEVVRGDVEGGNEEHGQGASSLSRVHQVRSVANYLRVVHHADRDARVEGTPVEGLDDALVGVAVGFRTAGQSGLGGQTHFEAEYSKPTWASGINPATRSPAFRNSAPRIDSWSYTRPGIWSWGRTPTQWVSVP